MDDDENDHIIFIFSPNVQKCMHIIPKQAENFNTSLNDANFMQRTVVFLWTLP